MLKHRLFLLLVFVISLTSTVLGSSLWSEDMADVYEDRPDYTIGDIVTVLIEEDSSAVQSANTQSNQESEVGASPGIGIFNFIKAFSLGYSDQDSADGQTQRQGILEASITAQIIERLPNGNLKIIGQKKIKVNNEEQTIKLDGIIRPGDISLDNKISSQKVANASIEFDGKGDVAHKQKTGVLSWLFGWLF